MEKTSTASSSKKINLGLWILQGLLALFFAAGSGAPKLILPADALPMPIPLPAALILFIGTCEVLGGLGLLLPGLTGVRPGLTIVSDLPCRRRSCRFGRSTSITWTPRPR